MRGNKNPQSQMRFSVSALKITEEATPREAVSWLGIALSFLLGFWTPYE